MAKQNGRTRDPAALARTALASAEAEQAGLLQAAEGETNAAREALAAAERALYQNDEPDNAAQLRADVDRAGAVVRRAERIEAQARVDREARVSAAKRELLAALREAADPDVARAELGELVPAVLEAERQLFERQLALGQRARSQRALAAELTTLARELGEPARGVPLPEGWTTAALLAARDPGNEMFEDRHALLHEIGRHTGQPFAPTAKLGHARTVELMVAGKYSATVAELLEQARATRVRSPAELAYQTMKEAAEADAAARSAFDCDPCERTAAKSRATAKSLGEARDRYQAEQAKAQRGTTSQRAPLANDQAATAAEGP
jgi:hypothetical protein